MGLDQSCCCAEEEKPNIDPASEKKCVMYIANNERLTDYSIEFAIDSTNWDVILDHIRDKILERNIFGRDKTDILDIEISLRESTTGNIYHKIECYRQLSSACRDCQESDEVKLGVNFDSHIPLELKYPQRNYNFKLNDQIRSDKPNCMKELHDLVKVLFEVTEGSLPKGITLDENDGSFHGKAEEIFPESLVAVTGHFKSSLVHEQKLTTKVKLEVLSDEKISDDKMNKIFSELAEFRE